MVPRQLKTLTSVTTVRAYEPVDIESLDVGMQDITVYPPPLFIMSPRIKLYKAADIVRFKGYLSKFEPEGLDVDGMPVSVMTITSVPDSE
jgi:hypothetical protein